MCSISSSALKEGLKPSNQDSLGGYKTLKTGAEKLRPVLKTPWKRGQARRNAELQKGGELHSGEPHIIYICYLFCCYVTGEILAFNQNKPSSLILSGLVGERSKFPFI